MTPDWVAIRSASAHQSPDPVPFELAGGVADGAAAEVVTVVPGGVPPDVPEAPGDLSQPASTATASAASTLIVVGMRTQDGAAQARRGPMTIPLSWMGRSVDRALAERPRKPLDFDDAIH